MSTSLTLVPLGDDQIQAAQQGGHVWASLKGMCESLSLDFSGQLRRLKDCRWAVMGVMPTTAADGKTYQTAMLRADKIPMWLVTVERSRIKDVAVREKIDRFQDEAADVLARHFLRPQSPPAGFVPLGAVRDVVSSLLTEMIAPVLSELRATATAIPTRAKRLPEPFTTIPDRCRYWGWESVPTKLRREIRDLAFLLCWEATGERPVITLQHSVWAGDQIPLLDRAIATVRQKYERVKHAGPRLF